MKMTLDEAIKHLNESLADQSHDWGCEECKAEHEQLAEWLKELKDLRDENKVLMHECDRLIKEKGELLKKVSGGDVLRICQLEEKLEKAKRLLKAAVEDMRWVNENTQDTDGTCVMRKCEGCGDCPLDINGDLWCKWKHEAEALKLIEGEEDENSI
jgi:hypothetical protein